MGWYTSRGRYIDTYIVSLEFETSDTEKTSVTYEIDCGNRDEALVEAAFRVIHFSDYALVSTDVRLKYGS